MNIAEKGISIRRHGAGFTIVELLIVIVIIGILAVIAIGAFSRAQDQARTATIQSDLKSAAKQLEQAKADTGNYPATGSGLPASPNTTYQYTYNAGSDTYCLTGLNGSSVYRVSSENRSPVSGNCAVPLTNLVANPSYSVNSTNWTTGGYGTGGVGSTVRTAGIGPTGGYAMRSTWTTASTAAGHSSGVTTNTALTNGAVYTASCYVRSNQAITSAMVRTQAGSSTYDSPAATLVPNSYARLSHTFTVNSANTSFTVSGRINNLAGTSDGLTFDVSNCMLTAGPTLYTYADGDSPGWTWSGTAGGSASSGPSL
ncbi:carbohydrate binding domain-containing protein [Candidatus Saccharibacteria bacterium]|nr:carbohydrate binding domain-containing protein [Candidatus Saccharibacteria bacterium]